MGEKEFSRYQTVQSILDRAQGKPTTYQYQGYRDFWNLPYDQFLEVTIYGVRMIAPPTDAPTDAGGAAGGCCSGGDPASEGEPSAVRPEPGRGRRSGLIQGLKGEAPFNGCPLPPLMWGGERVSPRDIQYIESWIDDGCPPHDDVVSPPPEPTVPGWLKACKIDPSIKTVNEHQRDNGKLKVRKNYESLTAEEVCKLRYAVGALQDLDRYPDDNRSFSYWAKVHGDHCQHGWEEFLPWHRAYLYRFERALQQVVPDVTLPYWDWTMPRYLDGAVPADRQSALVPTSMRCFIDQRAIDQLAREGAGPITGALESVVNDPQGTDTERLYGSTWDLFYAAGLDRDAYREYSIKVIPHLRELNPLWHHLRFPGQFYVTDSHGNPTWAVQNGDGRETPVLAQPGAAGSLQNAFHHHYPTASEVASILAINNWHDFGGGHYANQSFGVLSQNPHNTGHIWSGAENPFYTRTGDPVAEPQWGDMFNDLTAFFDPIGYAHHSNIDRLWWRWQQSHPGQNPDDPTAEMIPFHMTVKDLLDIHKLGYEYVRDARHHATDRGQEITHLATEPMSFDGGLLKQPHKVEIRFHNVLRAVTSYVVRVFVNQPGADAETPTEGNPNYVGYFGRFGHGPCVGGPGHCDPPPAPGRFEIPVRHHNTPHTYRLDATEAVCKLEAAEGEPTEIQVSAVVVHGNGEAREGLKMDGVSLHVLD